MRILYVAPRYHTNQADIVKGWIEHGDKVLFISQYAGSTENYDQITPVVIGYAKWYLRLHRLYLTMHIKNQYADNKKFKFGYPAYKKLYKEICKFKPNLVILRETCVYSLICYRICKKLMIPAILYNQSPYWQNISEVHDDILHKIIRKNVPAIRMTPVLGVENCDSIHEKEAYYVPFVTELHETPDERYSYEENCQIGALGHKGLKYLCIGKYEKRKNHLLMIRVFEKMLQKDATLELVIAGECIKDEHIAFKQELEAYIEKRGIGEKIKLLCNIPPSAMGELYREADIFVIPSSGEPASVSQLEAMSYSMPVICSDTNGTSCYVKDGISGWLFRNNDEEALLGVMEKTIDIRASLPKYGTAGYNLAVEKHSFIQYYQSIMLMKNRAEELQGIKRG